MHNKLSRLTLDELLDRAEMRRRLVHLGVDPYAQVLDVMAIRHEIDTRRAALTA